MKTFILSLVNNCSAKFHKNLLIYRIIITCKSWVCLFVCLFVCLHFVVKSFLTNFIEEKLTVTQLVKKFPAFYGIRRFITMFTTVRHWFLSWATWIQSTSSHPIYPWCILISLLIYTYVLQVVSSLQVFQPKFYTHFSFLTCVLRSRPSHAPWLNHSNSSWWSVQVMQLLVTQFL